GGILQEVERRPRLQLRLAREQLAVPSFQLAEMLLLLRREILEHLAAARIARHARRAGVELQPAALGRNRDAQRITREQQIRMPDFDDAAVAARAALLARAVDLHDSLRRAEAARAGGFFSEALDVGAEELERARASLVDYMEVA